MQFSSHILCAELPRHLKKGKHEVRRSKQDEAGNKTQILFHCAALLCRALHAMLKERERENIKSAISVNAILIIKEEVGFYICSDWRERKRKRESRAAKLCK